jgi:hypothetical protein
MSPRINVEDDWFDDPRREILAGLIGGVAADGVALRMWRLAQTYYRAGLLVPVELFEKVPHAKEFEAAGLAARSEGGVYIKGQRDRFEWLKKRAESGKRGGEKSRPNSVKKSDDAPGKQTKANESKSKQMEPSSSTSSSASASSSVSSSASASKEQDKYLATGAAPTLAKGRTVPTWEAYSGAYYDRYGTEPVRNRTVNSQLASLVSRLGEKEAPHVAAFYVRHPDQFYVRAKHPVSLLLRDCEGLRTEWATGRQVTTTEARQVDKMQATFAAAERGWGKGGNS